MDLSVKQLFVSKRKDGRLIHKWINVWVNKHIYLEIKVIGISRDMTA